MQKEILGMAVLCLYSSSIHAGSSRILIIGFTLEFGIFFVPRRFR